MAQWQLTDREIEFLDECRVDTYSVNTGIVSVRIFHRRTKKAATCEMYEGKIRNKVTALRKLIEMIEVPEDKGN